MTVEAQEKSEIEHLYEMADLHHISNFPSDIEQEPSEGFCMLFAIASAVSYVSEISPKDIFTQLYKLTLGTRFEKTELAQYAEEHDLPPLVWLDTGGTFVQWINTEHKDITVEFLNTLFRKNDLPFEIRVFNPQNSKEYIEILEEYLMNNQDVKHFPLITQLKVVEKGKKTHLHTVCLSPYSTEQNLLIHDSNTSGTSSLKKDSVFRMVEGEMLLEVTKGIEVRLLADQPVILVRAVSED